MQRHVFALIGLAGICLAAQAARGAKSLEYDEPYRPQIHYSPPSHWMNDPNGMVFLDGEYHLFYQYNPNSTVWGPMHWGHAVSKDMVHWVTLPIALYPDELGTIFSGSVVYDRTNTSGLGTAEQPPLVAIYTNHDHAAETAGRSDFQNQSIAFSVDKGRTWTKYSANPVLKNPGSRDFRDPKVSWFARDKKWLMTVAVADHVAFYSSPDLKTWSHESDFGRDIGAHGGVWECPDLIPMTVEGEAVRKYALLVSVNPGGPNGGSATQYFIGTFDGHDFIVDSERPANSQSTAVGDAASGSWVDHGTDDYAGVTWSGIPETDGRTLFLGWMSNWVYAREVPTERWRSAMTLPRELKLVRTTRGLELHSTPVAELAKLRNLATPIGGQEVQHLELTKAGKRLSGALELELTLDTQTANWVTLEFANSEGQKTRFRVNKALHRYELDRAASGKVEFNPHFSALQTASIPTTAAILSVRVFLDRSSVEIFINEGETVMTAIVFPSTPYAKASMTADRPVAVKGGTIYDLRSIWHAR